MRMQRTDPRKWPPSPASRREGVWRAPRSNDEYDDLPLQLNSAATSDRVSPRGQLGGILIDRFDDLVGAGHIH